MRLLVTGATGFLGWRCALLLEERGHDVVRVARPDGAPRAAAAGEDVLRVDAGDPEAQGVVRGCDAVLHFAGVPDPTKAAADPARAVRENAGTALNLLEGCLAHGAALLYPSTVRASVEPPPDAYALSKRLGEEVCRRHTAPATVLRLTSVFGPGQVAPEGATGAVASFAWRALTGRPIVIPGNPDRTRDFVYVDDLAPAIERIVSAGRWNDTITFGSGAPTPLRRVAELVVDAAGTGATIETPGGTLPPGENESYVAPAPPAEIGFDVRPLEEGLRLYVDWLRTHPAAQGGARA